MLQVFDYACVFSFTCYYCEVCAGLLLFWACHSVSCSGSSQGGLFSLVVSRRAMATSLFRVVTAIVHLYVLQSGVQTAKNQPVSRHTCQKQESEVRQQPDGLSPPSLQTSQH